MCLETYDKEIDNISYRTFERRLGSFKKWNGKVKPEILAQCGFYYLFCEDICKCFYCGVEIFRWNYNDCPIEEHYKYNKYCDLIECLRGIKNSEEKSCIKYQLNNVKYEKNNLCNNYIKYFLYLYFILEIILKFINVINKL